MNNTELIKELQTIKRELRLIDRNYQSDPSVTMLEYIRYVRDIDKVIDKLKGMGVPLTAIIYDCDEICCSIYELSIITREEMQSLESGATHKSMLTYDMAEYFIKDQIKEVAGIDNNDDIILTDCDYSLHDISTDKIIEIIDYQKEQLQEES